jgi:hypothetical protein
MRFPTTKDGVRQHLEVEAFFIVDTVGKFFNKVVGGPLWTEFEAETKLERMRDKVGDQSRYRIKEATMTIQFKPDAE